MNIILLGFLCNKNAINAILYSIHTVHTPGNVFCSWSAVCARIALSRSQYVRKAQPKEKKQENFKIIEI